MLQKITIFQSFVKGVKDGKKMEYTIDMYDRYCPKTDVISMARTTGYTATSALRMMAKGLFCEGGILHLNIWANTRSA
ncbi:MAG: hypothetical protein GY860_06355 [Desulfobacteraceae bacterium]|nr:hypothetical protein [Desulfobacteraceae bacterium]